MEKLFSIKEAAEMLGLKPSTLRKWVYLGSIEYCKVGGILKFSESQIRACIKEFPSRKQQNQEA